MTTGSPAKMLLAATLGDKQIYFIVNPDSVDSHDGVVVGDAIEYVQFWPYVTRFEVSRIKTLRFLRKLWEGSPQSEQWDQIIFQRTRPIPKKSLKEIGPFLLDVPKSKQPTNEGEYDLFQNSSTKFDQSLIQVKAGRRPLRQEPYDPDARDGDNDGIVQEGTPWERPAATRFLNEVGEQIQRGLTSTTRPKGKLVDADGNEVDYTPTYERAETGTIGVGRQIGQLERQPKPEQPKPEQPAAAEPGKKPVDQLVKPKAGTPLADHGAGSLKEQGLQSVRQTAAPQPPPEPKPPAAPVKVNLETPALERTSSRPRAAAKRLIQRLTRKNEAKLGSYDENGYGVPQVVPDGNKGIDNLDKAKEFLAAGGDLADVPDKYLYEAIRGIYRERSVSDDPESFRFEKIGDGDGVNGMALVRDNQTGKLLGLKQFNTRHEDAAEFFGANFAERVGFPNGVMRIGGDNEVEYHGDRAMVIELVQNYAGDPANVQFSQYGQNPNMWLDTVPTEDLVAMSILDFLSGNIDRHAGNFFVITDADGNNRLMPIDHSYCFGIPPAQQPGYLFEPPSKEMLELWVTSGQGGKRNEIAWQMSAINQGSKVQREEVVAAVRGIIEDLRASQSESPAQEVLSHINDIADISGSERGFNDGIERMEWLLDQDPEEIADILRRQAVYDAMNAPRPAAAAAPPPANRRGGLYG